MIPNLQRLHNDLGYPLKNIHLLLLVTVLVVGDRLLRKLSLNSLYYRVLKNEL